MIRSAAILITVSAIVGSGGPGPANAPTTAVEPVLLPPMTLRINADGTLEFSSLSKLFEPLPSEVTKNPAYLGPGPTAFPGAYLRDAMYREPYDRAELIARPYVTGEDDWLAGAGTLSADVFRSRKLPDGVEIHAREPVPSAPK